MKIAFQADADLNDDIVKGVKRRVPEIDFQNARDAALEGLEDRVVLSLAAGEGRILVTHDRRTMPAHFAEFITRHECPGVIVVSKKAQIALVIDELVLIWAAAEAEEYKNRIISIA
jgi:hypothetical protein